MKPIQFPEMTKTWAENQAPWIPLPAYTNERESISLWSLSLGERVRLLFTGKLWLRQCNFGQPLQPQLPQVESPFGKTK